MQAHQRLKITKDHTIKTKEEAAADNQSNTAEGKSLMCHVHPQVCFRKRKKKQWTNCDRM